VEPQERVESQCVVADPVGELEPGSHAVEGSCESLPEALRPRQADLDARLEFRMRRRLAQGFLEDRDGEVIVLELGEEEEGLRA
jgi:hypothetical protein